MRGIYRQEVPAGISEDAVGYSEVGEGIHGRSGDSSSLQGAFSLLEILVAMAILSLLLVVMASLASLTSTTSSRTLGKLESFETARAAFDTITRTLRQATLLSQITYNDPTTPTDFQRSSDLHFVSGSETALGIPKPGSELSNGVFFQAPLGLAVGTDIQSATSLLSCVGYFISYGDQPNRPSKLLGLTPARYRYRLFQFFQPREEMSIYTNTITNISGISTANLAYKTTEWFSNDVSTMKNCRVLAENVIGLVFLPIFADGTVPDIYHWNSRDQGTAKSLHRLPAAMKIVRVAIDEKSAARVGNAATPPDLMPTDLFLDPKDFEADLAALKDRLNAREPKLNYEIFATEVGLSSGDSGL